MEDGPAADALDVVKSCLGEIRSIQQFMGGTVVWFKEFDVVSETVRRRVLSLDCPTMELTQSGCPEPVRVQGPGVINFVNGRLQFKMFADKVLPRRHRDLEPGDLVPREHLWAFAATDMMGRRWTCDIVNPNNDVSYRCKPSGSIVTGNLWQIEGRFDEPRFREHRVTVDIPGSYDVPLNGSTEVVSRNVLTGRDSRASRLDSQRIETASCNLICEKGADFVRFKIGEGDWVPHLETRICESFQFVTARRTWWEAFYFAGPDDEYVRIRPQEHLAKQPRLRPPLSKSWDSDFWRLFGKYFDFVRSQETDSHWHPVSAFLDDVCEASIGSVALEGLVLAVAIEGIAEVALGDVEAPSDEFLLEVRSLVDHVKTWQKGQSPSQLKSTVRSRAIGAVSQLKTVRVKDRLLALAREGVIDRSLIENWQELRNTAAHGRSPTGRVTGSELQKLDVAQALLYRLICHAIGYTGLITDYSVRGWPDVAFP